MATELNASIVFKVKKEQLKCFLVFPAVKPSYALVFSRFYGVLRSRILKSWRVGGPLGKYSSTGVFRLGACIFHRGQVYNFVKLSTRRPNLEGRRQDRQACLLELACRLPGTKSASQHLCCTLHTYDRHRVLVAPQIEQTKSFLSNNDILSAISLCEGRLQVQILITWQKRDIGFRLKVCANCLPEQWWQSFLRRTHAYPHTLCIQQPNTHTHIRRAVCISSRIRKNNSTHSRTPRFLQRLKLVQDGARL